MTLEEYRARSAARKRRWRDEHPKYWVGLDGEGVTVGEPWFLSHDKTGNCAFTGDAHLYTSMTWRDANGNGKDIFDSNGLKTPQCLEFIASIPEQAKIMAYGFGYDLTKILEDLKTEDLYKLTHPILREVRFFNKKENQWQIRYLPVYYDKFAIDLFNTRFRVGYISRNKRGQYFVKKWRVVYDISKFYQCPFVTACERWDIGTPEERETMQKMKDDRRNLGSYTETEILDYSRKECQWGAILAQKLDDAHEKIGIKLGTQYYGAGSTAKALLKRWRIAEQIPELPRDVEIVAAFAFFGGRFEIQLRGQVIKEVFDWDIASAYPYQIAFLPCLQCGKWTLTKDKERAREASAAIIRYSLSPLRNKPVWGPFPFRDSDGTIPFPVESSGGWIYKDEFFAGAKLFPNVRFHEAWVYETKCAHRPFEQIPKIYLERLRIGKEGAGVVLKLGTNACAGSIMQTVGQRKYYCPVWAGMIMSGTRAQNLEFMAEYERLEDLIMIATDGQWSTKRPHNVPKPQDTGTDVYVTDQSTDKPVRKPLGSWEENVFPDGVFMARPGIYFPLGIKDKKGMKELKARGIGTRTLFDHRNELLAHYEKHKGAVPYQIMDDDPLDVIRKKEKPKGLDRFIGMRGGITAVPLERIDPDIPRYDFRRRDAYGLWSLQRRQVSFESRPKRDEGDGYHLETRRMPRGQFSCPYEKGKFNFDDLIREAENFGDTDDDQSDCLQ